VGGAALFGPSRTRDLCQCSVSKLDIGIGATSSNTKWP
jgi:hypothetical protein